jgi:hypothetical protein
VCVTRRFHSSPAPAGRCRAQAAEGLRGWPTAVTRSEFVEIRSEPAGLGSSSVRSRRISAVKLWGRGRTRQMTRSRRPVSRADQSVEMNHLAALSQRRRAVPEIGHIAR